MTTTIRKNSKEFKAAVITKGWTMSNLSNCFRAEVITGEFTDFEISVGKMSKDSKGIITLRIHSNLWYTLNPVSEPEKTKEKIIFIQTPTNDISDIVAPVEPVQYILEGLRQLAYNAHRNTSFSPEKRAQSVVVDYSNELNADMESMPIAERESYKAKYIDYLRGYLSSKSNTASTMITGGSGFNVARNAKRMGWAENKYAEFRDWRNRVLAAIEKRVLNSRSPQEKLNAEWLIISTKIQSSATTIKNIDLGIERGYSRALFVSSIAGLINRLAKNGQTELVNKSLDLITELNAAASKPILSASNSIWKLKESAEAARETIVDTANKESEVIPFEGGELIINHAIDRIQIKHYSKPSQDVIKSIKSRAFNWSGMNKAWQRKYTPQALAVAKQLISTIV